MSNFGEEEFLKMANLLGTWNEMEICHNDKLGFWDGA
jgi:hypothetical protein